MMNDRLDEVIKDIKKQNDEWSLLIIKYAVLYCYENKEKIAAMMPNDIDVVANVIYDNMQEILQEIRKRNMND